MKSKSFVVGALAVLSFFFIGCGPKGSHFQEVREAVFDGSEMLNTNVELSLGIVPLWMVETVASFVDDPEVQEARAYLDHLNRVDVGVYEVQGSFQSKHRAAAARVKASMQSHGFEPIVQIREKRETVGVYTSMLKDEFPEELFVVVMTEHEVVLVRLQGRFDKVIKAAVRNHAHELPDFNKLFKEEIVL